MKHDDGVFRGRVEHWIEGLLWLPDSVELLFRRKVNVHFFRHNYLIKFGRVTRGDDIEYFYGEALNCLEIVEVDNTPLVDDVGTPLKTDVDNMVLRFPRAIIESGMVIFLYQFRKGLCYGRKFFT